MKDQETSLPSQGSVSSKIPMQVCKEPGQEPSSSQEIPETAQHEVGELQSSPGLWRLPGLLESLPSRGSGKLTLDKTLCELFQGDQESNPGMTKETSLPTQTNKETDTRSQNQHAEKLGPETSTASDAQESDPIHHEPSGEEMRAEFTRKG